MTDRSNQFFALRLAALGLAAAGLAACDDKAAPAKQSNAAAAAPSGKLVPGQPNPDRYYPPSKAFGPFERLQTGKFYSTKQWTLKDTKPDAEDYIVYDYVYKDGRFDKVHAYDTDVQMRIYQSASAEKASARLQKRIAASIPLADAGKVKLPKCTGSKSDSDNFSGPEKLVKRIPNPRGGEIVVFRSGDFNMYDCTRGTNRSEDAVWTEGPYYFSVGALPMPSPNNDADAYGRAEEFAVDYVQALGPR